MEKGNKVRYKGGLITGHIVDAFGIYHNFSDKQLVQVEAKKYAAKLRAGEQP